MEKQVTVLLVEDERHHAVVLQKMVEKLEYAVVGWAANVKEALFMIAEQKPDIVLLDIHLQKGYEGFEVAKYINSNNLAIPFIFMTSLMDKQTIHEAAKLKPHAYLPKPYKANELFASIEMAILGKNSNEAEAEEGEDDALKNGCVFVRTKRTLFIKVLISDIMYFESDKNYCNFYEKEKKYAIRRTLAYVETHLDSSDFIRVQKSYIVNIRYIDRVTITSVFLHNGTEIPIGRTYKESIAEKIKPIS
jgi:DNA-binding LytR/AlgR family response regulator